MTQNPDDAQPCIQDDPAVYEQIFSSSLDSMSLVGKDFRYKCVNDSYLRRMQLPRSKIVGRHVAELLGQDVFERDIRPHFERCLVGQRIAYSRWFDYPGEGSRFMEVTYSPCRNSFDEIIGIVVNARDCTERRIEEKRREKAEAHFRELFAHAPMAAVIGDAEGTIIDCNDLMASLTGYSRDELIGLKYSAFTHPEDIGKELPLIRSRWTGGSQRFSLEKRYITKSGATIWAHTHVSSTYDKRGELEFNIAFIEDITEKRQLLEAVKESRECLRKALQTITYHLDNSPLGVIEMDGDLHIKKWNARAEEIFGWKTHEVAGKSPFNFGFVHKDDIAKVDRMLARIFKGIELHNTLILRNLTKSGEAILCKWYNSALRDEDGALASLLSKVEVFNASGEIQDNGGSKRDDASPPAE